MNRPLPFRYYALAFILGMPWQYSNPEWKPEHLVPSMIACGIIFVAIAWLLAPLICETRLIYMMFPAFLIPMLAAAIGAPVLMAIAGTNADFCFFAFIAGPIYLLIFCWWWVYVAGFATAYLLHLSAGKARRQCNFEH